MKAAASERRNMAKRKKMVVFAGLGLTALCGFNQGTGRKTARDQGTVTAVGRKEKGAKTRQIRT
jgi:hypothetical protein